MADYGAAQVVALVLMSDLVRRRVTLIATPGFGEGALAAIAANRDDLDRLNWANPSIGASPGPLMGRVRFEERASRREDIHAEP